MKIHSVVDIITNSSSSTFIVGFEEIPQTLEQMFDVLFPERRRFVVAYKDSLPTEEVAERVFADLLDAETSEKIRTKEQFIEVVKSGWFDGYPDTYNYYDEVDKLDDEFREKYGKESSWRDHPDWDQARYEVLQKVWKKRDEQVDVATNEYVDKKWEQFKDLKLFVFHYSDEGGEDVLEHGGIFDAVPHIIISNH